MTTVSEGEPHLTNNSKEKDIKSLTLKRTGLASISNFDYYIDDTKCGLQSATVKATNKNWHIRTTEDGRYSLQYEYNPPYTGHEPYAGNVVTVFPNAVIGADGNRYDLELTFSDIWIRASQTPVHSLMQSYNIGTFESCLWFQNGQGSWANVRYRVLKHGTTSPMSGTLLMSFTDLDQPGYNGYGTIEDYTEGGRIVSGILSPVYVEPNTYLKISPDNRTFTATKQTNSGDEFLSGFSFLGDASGTMVTLAVRGAGIGMSSPVSTVFEKFTATTYIRHQQKDGTYGEYAVQHRENVLIGCSYSYTWKRDTEKEPANVYKEANPTMVKADNIRADKTFYMSVPRHEYTYSFQANLPGESVTGVPKTVTNYAENKAPAGFPSHPHYTFLGWNNQKDGKGTGYQTTMLSNETWYGQWERNTYTLTYHTNNPNDRNDVNLSKTKQSVKYKDPWGSLATASKKGYVFLGWYTKPSGGTRITKDTVCNGNLNAYAHWRPITYTIRFEANGTQGDSPQVSGSTPAMTVSYDTKVKLSKNGFQKTTLTPPETEGGESIRKKSIFLGWTANPAGTKASYQDEAETLNLTTKDGDVITFYAVWDNHPKFIWESYPNRYFTLEEARRGDITEEELLRTVVAYDWETNPLPPVPGDDGRVGVTIVGYDSADFTALEADSTVSIRYKVTDNAGNTSYMDISVFVSENGHRPEEKVSYFRSLAKPYRNADEAYGGLAEESHWKNDPTYEHALDNAFDDTASARYHFDKGHLSKTRDYVEEHGLGNSLSSDALAGFWNEIGVETTD